MTATQTLNESVAAEIRAELGRANITHADFAQRLGMQPSSFSRRMRSEIPWNTEELEQVAKELRIEVTHLVRQVQR